MTEGTVRPGPGPRGDRAVSGIVAEILLVALGLALVAGAWVFFTGFTDAADPDDVPEDAVRVQRVDQDGDGNLEWIELTLVNAPNAPFSPDQVDLRLDDLGAGTSTDATASEGLLCTASSAGPGSGRLAAECDVDASNFLHPSATRTQWEAGQSFHVPCQSSADHILTLLLRGTLVLETQLTCQAPSA